jgi:hypothetical protein
MKLLPVISHQTWGIFFVYTIQCQARDLFWLINFVEVVSDQVGSRGGGWCGDSGVVLVILKCH